MTSGNDARPDALVALSELVAAAGGPLPAEQALPRLRELADQLGEDDGFGFAVIAYHALTGADPFPDGPAGAAPRPAAQVAPGLPVRAADALDEALAAEPAGRPTPDAVVRILEAQLGPHTEGGQTKEEFRRAIRDVVAPPHEVPRIGTLDADALPTPAWDPSLPSRDPSRRRRSSGRGSSGRGSSSADLRATLLVVAGIAVVALLSLLYAVLR